jgi:hypothetical protein
MAESKYLQVTPQYKATTFDERIKPLALYKQEYDRQQETYDKLLEDTLMLENLKGSDVDYYKMGSSCKFSSPEEAGRMVVFNGKLDAENYEQCQCYSEITPLGKANGMVDYLSNLFNKLRYN